MRHANNFHPEWGYLAPAPSFRRTARVAFVAAAVGASAGGAVVFSLVERPVAKETSVAARTLVQPADLALGMGRTQTAQEQAATQLSRQPQVHGNAPAGVGNSPALSMASVHAGRLAASDSGTSAIVHGSTSIAGLAEAPAATEPAPAAHLNETAAVPDAAPGQKKTAKKQRLTGPTSPRGEQAFGGSRGPLALLRPLTTPATTGLNQPRGEY